MLRERGDSSRLEIVRQHVVPHALAEMSSFSIAFRMRSATNIASSESSSPRGGRPNSIPAYRAPWSEIADAGAQHRADFLQHAAADRGARVGVVDPLEESRLSMKRTEKKFR
jgi:hypothetical protein